MVKGRAERRSPAAPLMGLRIEDLETQNDLDDDFCQLLGKRGSWAIGTRQGR